ncbi:MAG: MobQ family relaxase [Cyanobacteria bacterium J06629_9]
MALYRFELKVLSRTKSVSTITAKAAYRAGEKIYDPTVDMTFDYTRKQNVFGSEILAPIGAPDWAHDRSQLWIAVERKEDKSTRRNEAQLAREIILALPVELTHDEKQRLTCEYVQQHFVKKGMIADIGYHDFESHNPHAHVLLTMRDVTAEGFGNKNRSWNKHKLTDIWREKWADHVNRELERGGHEARVDHRSLKEQEIDREPQIHLGPQVIEMERKGVRTETGDIYRAIAAENHQRALQQSTVQTTTAALLSGTHAASVDAPELEADTRLLIEQWQQFKDYSPERSKPHAASWDDITAWGLPDTTVQILQTYTGSQAEQERDRRIERAVNAEPTSQPSALSDYLTGLKQRLCEKGRVYYRHADQWLTERLARRGYDRMQARRVIAQASPTLMDVEPGKRISFIRGIVNRVYKRHEERQEQTAATLKRLTERKDVINKKSSLTSRLQPPEIKPETLSQKDEAYQHLKTARRKQIKLAFNALNSMDFNGYRGQAIREYRKELARKIRIHGADMANGQMGIETDKDIAIRLYGAGYSQKQVREALTAASPQIAGQEKAIRVAYMQQHINPTLKHYKVRQGQQAMWDWRKEKGLIYERRLDRLELATTKPQPPEQEKHQRRGPSR